MQTSRQKHRSGTSKLQRHPTTSKSRTKINFSSRRVKSNICPLSRRTQLLSTQSTAKNDFNFNDMGSDSDSEYENSVFDEENYESWVKNKFSPIFSTLFHLNLITSGVAPLPQPCTRDHHHSFHDAQRQAILSTLSLHNIITPRTDNNEEFLPEILRRIKQPAINDVWQKLEQFNIINDHNRHLYKPGYADPFISWTGRPLQPGDSGLSTLNTPITSSDASYMTPAITSAYKTQHPTTETDISVPHVDNTIADIVHRCMVAAGGKDWVNGHFRIQLDAVPRCQLPNSDYSRLLPLSSHLSSSPPLNHDSMVHIDYPHIAAIQNYIKTIDSMLSQTSSSTTTTTTTPLKPNTPEFDQLYTLFTDYHRHDTQLHFQLQSKDHKLFLQRLSMYSRNKRNFGDLSEEESNLFLKLISDQLHQYLYDSSYLYNVNVHNVVLHLHDGFDELYSNYLKKLNFPFPLPNHPTSRDCLDISTREEYSPVISPDLAFLYDQTTSTLFKDIFRHSRVNIMLSPPEPPLRTDSNTTGDGKAAKNKQPVNMKRSKRPTLASLLQNPVLTAHELEILRAERGGEYDFHPVPFLASTTKHNTTTNSTEPVLITPQKDYIKYSTFETSATATSLVHQQFSKIWSQFNTELAEAIKPIPSHTDKVTTLDVIRRYLHKYHHPHIFYAAALYSPKQFTALTQDAAFLPTHLTPAEFRNALYFTGLSITQTLLDQHFLDASQGNSGNEHAGKKDIVYHHVLMDTAATNPDDFFFNIYPIHPAILALNPPDTTPTTTTTTPAAPTESAPVHIFTVR